MKFVITCDKKPESCKDCPFFGDVPVAVAANAIDIQTKCILGEFSEKTCPLNEIQTVFDTELKPEKSAVPTAYCDKCGKQVQYTVKTLPQPVAAFNATTTYQRKFAQCVHCKNYLRVESIIEQNKAEQNKVTASCLFLLNDTTDTEGWTYETGYHTQDKTLRKDVVMTTDFDEALAAAKQNGRNYLIRRKSHQGVLISQCYDACSGSWIRTDN